MTTAVDKAGGERCPDCGRPRVRDGHVDGCPGPRTYGCIGGTITRLRAELEAARKALEYIRDNAVGSHWDLAYVKHLAATGLTGNPQARTEETGGDDAPTAASPPRR